MTGCKSEIMIGEPRRAGSIKGEWCSRDLRYDHAEVIMSYATEMEPSYT